MRDAVAATSPGGQPASRTCRPIDLAAFLAGLGSLAVVAVGSALLPVNVGDAQTRNTIRLSLVWYAAALALRMRLDPTDWGVRTIRERLARWCWTWGCACFLVHVAAAFHFVHHWSQAHAFEHTREVGGFGEGLYVNYLFAAVWLADVLWWWLAPISYASRPEAIDGLLHGFMLFIAFNAAVVFVAGPMRWICLTGFAMLALIRPRRQRGAKKPGFSEKPGF